MWETSIQYVRTVDQASHIANEGSQENPIDRTFAVKEIKADNKEDAQEVAKHWASEVKALRKMNELNQHHIVRFITAFRRRKRDGEEHYLLFEWADGGNLRNLWKSNPHPVLTASLVREAIVQLYGLAAALDAAHNLNKTGASYRHGDLKPENILCFKDNSTIGQLKIGDWGEAKNHNVVTELRPSKTTAKYGTRRYESPEVETGMPTSFLGQNNKRRSRLYDIWAMGCITLEFIVWLLYGQDGLDKFNNSFRGPWRNDSSPFYQITQINNKKVARVHDSAVQWMDEMARDPACQPNTALGDLLEIVRNGLLVVKLPRRLGSNLSAMDTDRHRENSLVAASDEGPLVDAFPSSLSEGRKGSQDGPVDSIPAINIIPAEPPEVPVREPIQPQPESQGPARFLAKELRDQLEHILSEDESEGYWYVEKSRKSTPLGFGTTRVVLPDLDNDEYYSGEVPVAQATNSFQTSATGLVAPELQKVRLMPPKNSRRAPSLTLLSRFQIDYASPPLDEDDWEFQVDNQFAGRVFSSIEALRSYEVPSTDALSAHCVDCNAFRESLWTPGFEVTYKVQDLRLKANSKVCKLCGLLWRTCRRNNGVHLPTVQFDRVGSCLKMNGSSTPALSIFRRPRQGGLSTNDFQIGFANLPDAGSSTYLEVIRHWLNDCDGTHKDSTCRHTDPASSQLKQSPARLPTRLIDVGEDGDRAVRLWETSPCDTGKWIALSHQWGSEPHFSTYRSNIQNHLSGIEINALPATFRDAIIVTRGLGHRYLWIDSICVIQGVDGDFGDESKRMEEVYSGAYCVLAASRATDHRAGFLQPRKPRDYITLQGTGRDDVRIHLCQTIDNFKEHVLEGALNRRGWVLQEHALARRTVFFTDYQTYFECGHGVRCETMTHMKK